LGPWIRIRILSNKYDSQKKKKLRNIFFYLKQKMEKNKKRNGNKNSKMFTFNAIANSGSAAALRIRISIATNAEPNHCSGHRFFLCPRVQWDIKFRVTLSLVWYR
jgi:hypothetical protein